MQHSLRRLEPMRSAAPMRKATRQQRTQGLRLGPSNEDWLTYPRAKPAVQPLQVASSDTLISEKPGIHPCPSSSAHHEPQPFQHGCSSQTLQHLGLSSKTGSVWRHQLEAKHAITDDHDLLVHLKVLTSHAASSKHTLLLMGSTHKAKHAPPHG